jgi:hypothetical protein
MSIAAELFYLDCLLGLFTIRYIGIEILIEGTRSQLSRDTFGQHSACADTKVKHEGCVRSRIEFY